MFTKSLSRVARSAQSFPQSCSTAAAAAVTVALPRSHQRRLSSSKAPCPPGGGPADPTASNAARTPAEEQKRSGRLTRRKSRDNAADVATKARDDAYANLPSVPPTSNLHPTDVGLSTFFSLHRPISVTSPIPPPSDPTSFAAIFEPRPSSLQKTSSSDVIYTLSSAVSALEGEDPAQSSEERDLRWELVRQSSSDGFEPYHGGAMSAPTLEQLVKQFRPFNVPPPPVPFEEAEAVAKEKKIAAAAQRRQRGGKGEQQQMLEGAESQSMTHKKFTTTLTINEATSPDGQKTYTASASPIIEHDIENDLVDSTSAPSRSASADAIAAADGSTSSGRTVRRMIMLDELSEGRREKKMLLISVKRIRKLKMKKHKYKKLMKRTRNLRRREGRT